MQDERKFLLKIKKKEALPALVIFSLSSAGIKSFYIQLISSFSPSLIPARAPCNSYLRGESMGVGIMNLIL